MVTPPIVRALTGTLLLLASCGPGKPAEQPPVLATAADSVRWQIKQLEHRILDQPSNAALYEQRATLYERIDSTRRALADMQRAITADSNNAAIRLHAADLYYRTVDMEKAELNLRKAIELAPTDVRPRLKLAEMFLVLRRYKESMTTVNDALRIDPNAAHGYFIKGWIHMETQDTAMALSSFRTAAEQDPQDYDAFVVLGKLSAALHDPLAEQYYNSALEVRPRSVEAYYNKGIYLQENGKDSAALACYDRIKEIDPKNALAWYNSGWVRMEHLNDLEQAKLDFSKAIELETNYADAWFNRGLAMERTQQLDSAAANYQICLSIDPAHNLAAEGVDRLAKRGVRIKSREARK